MHVPWASADNIVGLFQSRRWTIEGLRTELRRQYNYVMELVDLAYKQDPSPTIRLPFKGQQIGPFTFMSPSIEMYEGLMPQFRDTPKPDQNLLQHLGHWLEGIGRRIAKDVRKIVEKLGAPRPCAKGA